MDWNTSSWRELRRIIEFAGALTAIGLFLLR